MRRLPAALQGIKQHRNAARLSGSSRKNASNSHNNNATSRHRSSARRPLHRITGRNSGIRLPGKIMQLPSSAMPRLHRSSRDAIRYSRATAIRRAAIRTSLPLRRLSAAILLPTTLVRTGLDPAILAATTQSMVLIQVQRASIWLTG